jgi:hypothetical protein
MTFPVFASGDVLNASDMNAVGMWLVKTQTIGTTVSSVTVTGAFSADYDNYFVTISGGAGSQSAGVNLTLGSTSTGYYYAASYNTYAVSTVLGFTGANTSSIQECCYMSTGAINFQMVIKNPFLAKNTFFNWQLSGAATSSVNLNVNGGGYLADTTSYTAFTLTPTGGTLTGGTIRVYGYRN